MNRIKTMSSTGLLSQNKCGDDGKCTLLEFNDSQCDGICKGCVGIADFGLHNKCTSACRKCRNFGTTWEPRRPMKPLNYTDLYTDYPGYSTTGNLVEHFGMSDISGNPVILFVIIMVLLNLASKFGYVKYDSITSLAMWAALLTIVITLLKRFV